MISTERTVDPAEEARLDRAIASIDPKLKASLQRDQQQRHWRIVLIGGLIMLLGTTLVGAVLASGFLLNADEQGVDNAVASADLTTKGYKLWQSGSLAEAAKRFERAVKLDPENSNAWNGLGWANFNQGHVDEGRKAFEKCVELAPDNAAALNGLGQIYVATGEIEKAEPVLLKAKRAPAAWFGLMKLYLLKAEFQEAKIWLEKIEDSGAAQNLANIDKIKKAIEDKVLPDDLKRMFTSLANRSKVEGVDALFRKGRELSNKGQFRPAQLAFEEVLEKDPGFAEAKLGLAYCVMHQGKVDEAKQMFVALNNADKNDVSAKNGLALCFRHAGEYEKAIAQWKELETMPGGVLVASGALGTLYFEQEKFDQAIPYLETITKRSPKNAYLKKMLDKAKSKVDANTDE